jgi:hypothetical protein
MPPKILLNSMNYILKLHAVKLQTSLPHEKKKKKKKKKKEKRKGKGKIIKHIMDIVR